MLPWAKDFYYYFFMVEFFFSFSEMQDMPFKDIKSSMHTFLVETLQVLPTYYRIFGGNN